MRESVNRYYRNNSDQIITNKTVRLARLCGRVPRETTIRRHGMDRKVLESILLDYQMSHPETRAARKIFKFLQEDMRAPNCDAQTSAAPV